MDIHKYTNLSIVECPEYVQGSVTGSCNRGAS